MEPAKDRLDDGDPLQVDLFFKREPQWSRPRTGMMTLITNGIGNGYRPQ